jgi:hypothetical protein
LIDLIDNLLIDKSFYYIKRDYVVEKIEFKNRTFYAKFEKIYKPLDKQIIKNHIDKKITIASTLVRNDYTNNLIFIYKGDDGLKFYHTIKQLFIALKIEKYYIFQGKSEKHIQVFIPVNKMDLAQASIKLEEISKSLALKLPVEWQTLPNKNLPYDYNIFTLPYKIFE